MLNLSNLLIPLLLILIPKQQQLTFAATADSAACIALHRSDIERRLSTKTPYRAIANYNDTSPIYNGMPVAILKHGICAM